MKLREQNPYEKVCRYELCKSNFIAKRTNQEFCCPKHKSLHDSIIKKKPLRDLTKRIDHILHENLRVIQIFFEAGKTKVSKRELLDKGYNENYFTSFDITKDNELIFFLYGFRVKKLNNDTYEISKT